MNFETVQSDYKTRLDADSWFVSKGVTTRLSKSAKAGDVSVLNAEVEADLKANGMSFVVKAPRLTTLDVSRSGRALFGSVIEVLVLENPMKNRVDGGLDVTGVQAAVETFKALLGHHEISLDETPYMEAEGPQGLIAYVIRTVATCVLTPR